ncbi:unnamed protein product [Gordionus sp. m RMFG-2023]
MGNGVSSSHSNHPITTSRVGKDGGFKPKLSKNSINNYKNNTKGSSEYIIFNGEKVDSAQFHNIIVNMQSELNSRDEQMNKLENLLRTSNKSINDKNIEINQLKQEIDKLRSVLDRTTSNVLAASSYSKPIDKDNKIDNSKMSVIKEESQVSGGNTSKALDIKTSSNNSTMKPTPITSNITLVDERKKGVSGESASKNEIVFLEKHNKGIRSKQMIKDAILKNDFLKNLDQLQIKEIIECMYEKYIKAEQWVIREGDLGQHLFVLAEGELEVMKNDKSIGLFGPGNAFGELALLYNCPRTASVKAVSDSKIWVLDRKIFQTIMMKTGLQRQDENIKLLRSVPLLQNLPDDKLAKLAGILELEFFHGGEYIIREGTFGDDFFIIISGQVLVTQKIQGREQPQEVRKLNRGEYFGERALLKEDRRTANVIALIPGVECLTIDRDSFVQLIGDLQEFQNKDYGDEARGAQRISLESSDKLVKVDPEYQNLTLKDIETITCLGQGGFGRVDLVHVYSDPNKSYALKCITKQYVVESRQQEHIFNEKKIMMEISHPFICKCFRTFKDSKYVYLLLEACLGGEVWTILRDRNHFDDITARFYTACIIESLGYLHDRGIIYRDLKPENMLLDTNGYCKLVDFGFAKKIGIGRKTWTFCGTPEYVAPEIILNKGHDQSVDYWAIGILMFELLTGMPPFTASEPMKTYNLILKGIDMLTFPRQISKTAQSLIKKLCRDNPAERLGYQKNGISDIRKHKWFHGFDWEGLVKKQLTPPIKPIVTGPMDHANFDIFSNPLDYEPPNETSGWDDDF